MLSDNIIQDLPTNHSNGAVAPVAEFAGANDTKLKKFVTFYIANSLYAIEAERVAEVIHPVAVTPLPNAPPLLLGIFGLRGEIIALLNLKQMLDVDAQPNLAKTKFVVLHSVGETTQQLAFSVDKMHEVVLLAEDSIVEADITTDVFLFGRAMSNSKLVNVIAFDSLAAVLETQ